MSANLFSSATDYLRNTLIDAGSEQVIYRRGASEIAISAILGETKSKLMDQNGLEIDIRMTDFLIQVEDLDFGSGQVKPEVGDEIERTIGTVTITHEVLNIMDQQGWRYSDRFETIYRIHTKESDRV